MIRPAAILFDIDGTLVDSNDLHADAWMATFAEAEIALPRDAVRDKIGMGADKLVPALIPDADDAQAERLGKRHGELFKADYIDRVTAFPAVHALFEALHARGIRILLASSAGAEEVEHHLDLIDARDLVEATTSSEDAGESKPAPDIFEAALKKLAPLSPDRVLVVGDTPYDIEAAAKLGLTAYAVRSGGFDDGALFKAAMLFDDPADLLARIDDWA